VPGELLVRWKPTVKALSRAQAMGPVGATREAVYDLAGVELLHVDGVSVPEAAARLSLDPRVEYAEPNYLVSIDRAPDDPRYAEQYGLHNTGQTGGLPGADIGAERAWERFTGDPTMLIGDIDTGADYDHPDLAPNIWTNPGEIPGNGVDDDHNGYVDDVHGYDFIHHDGDPRDDNGHGTHTAGTIAAVGNNGIGVTGVVWRAKLVLLKFLGANGSGPTSLAVEALQYAVRLGVRVTNNSWGGGAYSRALEDAIAAAGAAGMLVVCAAGNSRSDTDRAPQYPGALPEDCIITVAATDNADRLASFSNWGETSVDLGAPGVDVLSTAVFGNYKLLSGTSMATPHVTGAVAFLMGRFPRMDAAQVKARLLDFVDPLPGLDGRCVSGGRLNLDLASADPDLVSPGGIADLSVARPGSNSMDLAWTATGDDGDQGTATRYDLRYATHPFAAADFDSATLTPAPRPGISGTRQTWRVNGLVWQTSYWFAVRARDEFGNLGTVSNVVSASTLAPPRISLSAADVTAASTTGNVIVQAVELANDSQGTLDWRAPTPSLNFSGAQQLWPADPAPKGEPGESREPQTESSGGPDPFGYRWADSAEPGGPAFQWVDVAQPANILELTGDERFTAPVPLGFSFPFYGRRFTHLRVCTNGYLQFGTDDPLYSNTGLPSPFAPREMIAPFWDDLHFGSGVKRAYAHYDGTRFVVGWIEVPRYNDLESVMTFECILYPSGEIRFQYLHMTGNATSATVGIQDSSRTAGLLVAYNQAYVQDGLAVRIVPLRQWLTVEPSSGFLGPGERQALELHFDASGLGTAVYTGRAEILSNDPAAPDTAVKASFVVTGAPDIEFSPPSLDFGAHFTGARDTLSLTVANAGVDPLDVTRLSTDEGDFSALTTPFRLLPGEATTVPVVFAPASIADHRATLLVTSNDPDLSVARIPLHGVGSAAPEIAAVQTAFRVAATPELDLAAARREQPLVIRNQGGAPLVWTASAYQGQIAARPGLRPGAPQGIGMSVVGGEVRPAGPRAKILQIKGSIGPGAAALGDGGPDTFGYRWIDSDAPGGPVFGWEEIAAVGTRLFGSADDSTTRVALPFRFTFYGHTYDSVSVCTNGFLCFVGRDSSLVNTDLPSDAEGVPRALVAPFWTDLDLRTVRGPGRVYAHFDGSKLVVEWKDAVHFAGASPYTFQVFLWPSGQIEYQYLSLGALTSVATIGIQDETGTIGLRVAYRVPYVHPNLRVRLSHQDDWLTLDHASGSIPPGAADTLRVRFDSRQYKDGDYSGEVRIASNDVDQPQLAVPCAMHVGLLRDPAELQPAGFDAVSVSPIVRFLLSAPSPLANVIVPSLRLNEHVVRPALEPVRESDGRLSLAFRAVDLLALVGRSAGVEAPGAARPDTLTGEYDAGGWFAAGASLAISAPGMAGGPLPAFGSDLRPTILRGGAAVDLAWLPPAGGADAYDVAYSADGGVRWSVVDHGPGTAFRYVPPEPATSGLLEVVARRGDAVAGTWLSAPFIVLPSLPGPGPSVPLAFALRLAGASPARDILRFKLELPQAGPGEVAVFDLRGARVRDLARGELPQGRLGLTWDGTLRDGSRAAPGVYLVRARHATGAGVLRVVLLR
jgi:subtilisin family serine protease